MKKKWTYLITVGVGLAIALIIMACEGIFSETSTVIIFQRLSDAFFVAGAILVCCGAIVSVSNGGAFDMLRYGGIKFIDQFRRDVVNKKYHTYYDFREAQKEKKRSFWYLIIVGAALIVVGVVMFIIYKTQLNAHLS